MHLVVWTDEEQGTTKYSRTVETRGVLSVYRLLRTHHAAEPHGKEWLRLWRRHTRLSTWALSCLQAHKTEYLGPELSAGRLTRTWKDAAAWMGPGKAGTLRSERCHSGFKGFKENLISIHEDAGSIPDLAQLVKNPALL